MKKLFTLVALAAFSLSVCAAESSVADDNDASLDDFSLPDPGPESTKVSYWPAFFAVGELPDTPDLIGLRLTIPFSSKQENVTGFDIGFWGQCHYFEGFQIDILRNDVKDQLSGVQIGVYNTAAQADFFGAQAGLWNEVGSIRGVQVGLVNTVGQMQGVQVGLINRAEGLYGFQVGVVNVIRDSQWPFIPVVNVGF